MKLSPKQAEVLNLFQDKTTTEILAGGAAGGGKSRSIAIIALKMALKYTGCRLLIGRHELKRLKETTLVTFLEVTREQGIQVNTHFRINHQDNFIQFINGSRILLADLAYMPSDPNFERLGSLELTAALVDEASEITERCKDVLTTRINRWKNEEYGFTGKILMSCNPHKGWLYHAFYKPWKAGVLPGYKAFVPMNARDNPWLSPAYIMSLERLPNADRERLLYGNWEYDDDPAWLLTQDKVNDLWTNTFVDGGEKFLTCDLAMMGSDKYVVIVWNGYRMEHIFQYPKITGKEIEGHVKTTAELYEVPRSNIVFDSDGLGEFLGSYLEGAVPFHNGGRPIERVRGPDDYKENYANLKTQCYFELAKKIQANEIYIVNEDYKEIISEELAWVKRDRLDKDGKLYLLAKDKVKRGLGRSPDFADAMAMRMFFTLDRERDRDISGVDSRDDLLGQGNAYQSSDDYTSTNSY